MLQPLFIVIIHCTVDLTSLVEFGPCNLYGILSRVFGSWYITAQRDFDREVRLLVLSNLFLAECCSICAIEVDAECDE